MPEIGVVETVKRCFYQGVTDPSLGDVRSIMTKPWNLNISSNITLNKQSYRIITL